MKDSFFIDLDKAAKLVVQFQQGNTEAFEKLYQLFYKQQLSLLMGIVKDEAMAADVVQDAFVSAYQNIGALKNPRAFQKWLSRIAYNKCMSRLNEESKASAIIMEGDRNIDSIENEDSDPLLNPEKKMLVEERNNLLTECMAQLSAEHRAVLIYFYHENMSAREIARITKSNIGAVYKRLYDARAELKKRVNKLPSSTQQILKKTPAAMAVSVFMEEVSGKVSNIVPQNDYAFLLQQIASSDVTSAVLGSSASAAAASAVMHSFSIQKTIVSISVLAIAAVGTTVAAYVAVPESVIPEMSTAQAGKTQTTNDQSPQDAKPLPESVEVLPEKSAEETPPVIPPTIQIAQETVTYPLGFVMSLDQIVNDAGISAVDGKKKAAELAVSNYEYIDFDYAGDYLLIVKATDAQGIAAETKIVTVKIAN